MSEDITDYTKILPTGKSNAVSSRELATRLVFANTRTLQADIAKSREAGQVILSSSTGGYYLPANDNEIQKFIDGLQSRAINTFKAIESAKKALKKSNEEQSGQITLDDIL